jgi:NADPH:quinone reductase-like Zn-dependent oxidoreductase
MKAAVIEQQGTVDNLVYRDWPEPRIASDEVLMRVIAIPDGVTFEQAAALPVGYGTAHHIMFDRARVQSGELVLILGAAGEIEPVIESIFPLAEIRAAQTKLENRNVFGKVVLRP